MLKTWEFVLSGGCSCVLDSSFIQLQRKLTLLVFVSRLLGPPGANVRCSKERVETNNYYLSIENVVMYVVTIVFVFQRPHFLTKICGCFTDELNNGLSWRKFGSRTYKSGP